MTFGDKIKIALIENHLNQAQLAKLLFVKPGTLNSWVRGRTEPSIADIIHICQILHVSSDWLLGVNDGNKN